MADHALSDVTVVDLSQTVAGAFCSKLLSGLGARVIKVEPPEGEAGRWLGPFKDDVPGLERSGPFLYLNTDKESMALSIQTGTGRRVLCQLLERADLLIEDFGPGGLEAQGLDEQALRSINPRLVVIRLSPFGSEGPYRDYKGTDLVVAALSGWMALTGEPDREPLKARGHMVGACIPGIYAAVSGLAALHWRDASGQGQQVEISGMEAYLSTSRFYETTYAATGLLYRRAGQHLAYTFPCGLLPCKDGYITVVAAQDSWELLCRVMGLDDLADDPELRTPMGRWQRAAEITPRLAGWLRDHTREECFHLFQQMRIITGMVCNTAEVVGLEQFQARGFFVDVDHPVAGHVRMPGPIARLSQTPWRLDRPAPLLGEHTGAILKELGYDGEAGVRLVERSAGEAATAASAARSEAPAAREATAPASGRVPALAGPLAGIRVLDLTTYMAGPFAAMALADLGAEVIKIEAVQRVDAWRVILGTERPGGTDGGRPWETSPLFNAQHRNKLGITLNLASEQGRRLFKELVRVSDVVLENYSSRVMPNFGLGFDQLKEVNPGIVMLSLTGLGSRGPWKDYISMAQVGESLGGIYGITGYADGHLAHHTPMPADPASGLVAATAVLAALHHRARTGEGQHIEVAQAEVIASITADAIMDYTLNGRVWDPVGNKDSSMAPHDVYPCAGADEWIAIAVGSDEEWRALRSVMGDPDWAADPRFDGTEGRYQHQGEIDRHLALWTRGFSARDLMERLQSAGVAAGAVQGPRELLEDPHLRAREYWREVDRPHVGVLPYPRSPMRFTDTPVDIRRPAPLLGEHNDTVLRDILGLTEDEIAALEREQVIGSAPLGVV